MRLVWLARAVDQRDSQLDYIAAQSPAAAIRIGEQVALQVAQLAATPALGRPGRIEGTRELVIARTPLIAVYRINEPQGRVEILAILHGAQMWPPIE
ncbi:type II toxin-antitoxin system RelE/ParE family toxin [Niveibacterium sp. 24ML]|uniref:type II toxin-antitoxin system RelE/ParE family toxin n=1 Tax=Niveibacterium sp. 24ML TaxID=2985512 RepID=UPI00226DA221|nr:type II toxin-antitoxin system RelE/ParE family toxin [Niveibacterium sp. 24ML]MCX9158146.1 type II toxin-antitoxin system RelE/ParE family toxin [Niveibacterium sp. 24ML]